MNTQGATESQAGIDPEFIREAADEASDPRGIIEKALEKLAADPGALFEEAVLDALRSVRSEDPAQFARYRARAKKINKSFRLAELDRLIGQDGAPPDDGAMTRLIVLARAKCQLCHTADRRGVALIERDQRREVWMVREAGFREWLRAEYFNEYEAGVPDTALAAAISTIEAIGVHRGEQVEVHTRCAKSASAFYIDLCDEHWRVVKVDQSGWQVVDRPPVLFTRSDNMRSLPEPLAGGDLRLLWKHVNVPKEQRPLVVTWVIDSLRPDTPFPALEIIGEQGSAKSTTQRLLRDLIDPNKVALRGSPKTVEDIFVAAANNWVVSYENLSYLNADEQDALCTLSTGGGFATRLFHTNGGEHVLQTKRPVMLNGISGVATRPDLIERTIRVDAPAVPAAERKEEADIDAGWEGDRASIFGALLDQFSAALRCLPDVQLERRQRMADFERLGEACTRAEGQAPGAFSRLYAKAIEDGIERSLESFGVANALTALMAEGEARRRGEWSGTVGQLYQILPAQGIPDRASWPRSPRGLTEQLNRLAPALRAQGLEIIFGPRGNGGRRVTIRQTGNSSHAKTPAAVDPADGSCASPGITDTTVTTGTQ